MPVTRIVFWRNGQGFLNGGSINFGWDGGFDNVTWSQTLSGVFGNFSHTRTLPTRKKMAWNCDLRMRFTHQDIADMRIVGMKTVTKPKPPADQLEDRLRRLPANRAAPVPVPASVQEVPTVAKLLQRLVAEIQSHQPAAVTKPKPPLDQLEDLLGRLLENRAAPVYKARPVDWAVSMQSTSDGVTRFRIFPKTWTMLSMAGSPPFSRKFL